MLSVLSVICMGISLTSDDNIHKGQNILSATSLDLKQYLEKPGLTALFIVSFPASPRTFVSAHGPDKEPLMIPNDASNSDEAQVKDQLFFQEDEKDIIAQQIESKFPLWKRKEVGNVIRFDKDDQSE